jgi:hypothetical protein
LSNSQTDSKGYFPESTAQIDSDLKYCFVHIDCDLYAPALSALEYFYPRMTPGGFIVIHDYGCMGWDGAERAVDEFFADKPESIVQMPDSAGSAVVRKNRDAKGRDNWRLAKAHNVVNAGWTPAGNNKLAAVLGKGWSIPESWGVWGVGTVHELNLVLPENSEKKDLRIEIDLHAPIGKSLKEQLVEFCLNGLVISKFNFDERRNRGVRTVTVDGMILSGGIQRISLIPRHLFVPSEHVSSSRDHRVLGVALHGLSISLG